MGEKNILSVGYDIPAFEETYLSFKSARSLLDADIVVFNPTLRDFYSYTYYQGKRRISDDDSPNAVEHCRRWRQELIELVKSGKTAVVFLAPIEEVYVHLGEKTVSGTGRNQKVTYIVEPLNSYTALPFDLGTVVPKGGHEIRVLGDLKALAPYWAEFGSRSPYKVYLKQPKGTPILSAKMPDAIVGLFVKIGKGTAVLLPPLEYNDAEFTGKNKKGQTVWTKQAIQFGKRFVAALVELDRAFCAESEVTPAPAWVRDEAYTVPAEVRLEAQIRDANARIDALRSEREALGTRAAQAAALRDLLYEAGKPLERAVLRALKAMGFTAIPFREDGSEFDAVFSASEGRFIGEVEGKNDKAVSIEKLDQLERNIREDFARQESGMYAKGVLFGNAYRLRPPVERPASFTTKCHAAASRGKVSLVRTADLFPITRYLEDRADEEFASKCRAAIVSTEGAVVTFPPLPSLGDEDAAV
jgi:hypothetical protein